MHNLVLNITPEQASIIMQILSDHVEKQDDDNYSEQDMQDCIQVMTQINNALDATLHVINENKS